MLRCLFIGLGLREGLLAAVILLMLHRMHAVASFSLGTKWVTLQISCKAIAPFEITCSLSETDTAPLICLGTSGTQVLFVC